MLKRFFCGLLLLSMIVTLLPLASAGSRPDLSNPKKYVLAWEQGSSFAYIQRDSVTVDRYDPPNYEITVTIVYRSREHRSYDPITEKFSYDYGARKMYCQKDGEPIYLPSDSKDGDIPRLRAVGEMAFYLANNRNFYGKDGGYKKEFYRNASTKKHRD